jgi:hypothetical protein
MFQVSDEFYQSLGLPENSMSYNESVAMIEKPEDGRVVVCHASAWDFCDRSDFRLAERQVYASEDSPSGFRLSLPWSTGCHTTHHHQQPSVGTSLPLTALRISGMGCQAYAKPAAILVDLCFSVKVFPLI